jgi:hypothetical protein
MEEASSIADLKEIVASTLEGKGVLNAIRVSPSLLFFLSHSLPLFPSLPRHPT